jgi:hypothetical protein
VGASTIKVYFISRTLMYRDCIAAIKKGDPIMRKAEIAPAGAETLQIFAGSFLVLSSYGALR